MYKYIILGFLILTLFFCTSSCGKINHNDTVSSNANQNADKNNEITTLEELKEISDVCVFISTFETYETKNENNQLFSEVEVIPVAEWQLKCFTDNITIIEYTKSYIEPESVYIVFLSESEDNDGYYLSCGKSSIFSINRGDIKPLDYRMGKEVKTHWNNRIRTFEAWFTENYPDPPQAPEDTIKNTTTINISTTSDN